MKTRIQLLLLLTFGLSLAQKNKTNETLFETDKQIYKNALKYNDANTAIISIHNIIAKEGENTTYKDSLAILYYKTNNFVSSYFVTKELLEKKPKDLQLLEINAISLQNIGDSKKAVTAYETLFALSKNQYHGYQLATIQFNLKRFGEAQTTIQQTLSCQEIKEAQVQIPVDKDQTQNVPLKAALSNLQGLVAYELKDNAYAKKSFENALTILPEFILAKQNIAALEKEIKK
ncbi:hypothetical protein [Flavobacterium sp.]|uniref:hypothetical protein n=1 Tax=Flavobacterium sp. TaxID=239 RepID=UPI003752F30E